MDPLAASPAAAAPTVVPAVTPVSGAPGWGVGVVPVAAETVNSPYAGVATGYDPAAATVPGNGPEVFVQALQTALAAQAARDAAAAQAVAAQGAVAAAVPTTEAAAATVAGVVGPDGVAAATLPMAGALQAAASPAPSVAAQVTGAVSTAAGAVASVAGAGISKARQVGSELWAGIRSPKTSHVTQVPSKYNQKPAAGNRDCGPTSVVIALKMVGKGVPGTSAKTSPQGLINQVRKLAGSPDNTESTDNFQLAKALRSAGASTREIRDLDSIKDAIEGGKPVILNGNPRHSGAYGPKFSANEMTPFDGAHWIVVTGFDKATGQYIINDPLSKIGPVKVSASQLEAYRGGSLGIEVSA